MIKKMIHVLLCLFLIGCTAPVNEDTALYTYFFKAGKADAILLYTKDSAVLIDSGTEECGGAILSYMRQIGIPKLDAMIITHFDKDHVGGAAEVLNSTDVREVYISDVPKDSQEYAAFMSQMEKKKLEGKVVFGTESTELLIGGVVYSIDGPDQSSYGENDSNNSSLIIRVSYGKMAYLFTGDADNERLEEYLKDHTETCNLLKIPHHGRWQKSLKNLMETCDPIYTVICTDEAEDRTVSYLEDFPAEVYVTENGALQVTTDGEEIVITRR